MLRLLLSVRAAGALIALAVGLPGPAQAGDPILTAAAGIPSSGPSAPPPAATNPAIEMDPMVVNGSRPAVDTGNIAGYGWNISELTEGSYFHLRRLPLIDAIGFRHQYLEEHPGEKAIVITVVPPPDNRVTQALCAYTAGAKLHLHSAALGDISPPDLSVADIDHPEAIQDFVQAIRDRYMSHYVFERKFLDPSNIVGSENKGHLVVRAVLLAGAEETGDYSKVVLPTGQPIYKGSADDMLTSAFYWLNSTDKVGLIPVARSRVTVMRVEDGASTKPKTKSKASKADAPAEPASPATRDSIVFDWDQTHYLYNDLNGTLALPLPKNPVTDRPYLVLKNGDLLEALYFAVTFAQQHPEEPVAFLPPADGIHAAVAYSEAGKLWMMSPYLGKFALPPRFHIEQADVLAKVHAALVQREMKKLPPGSVDRPAAAFLQAMPGDSGDEQIRRAYLAFKAAGVPIKFASNDQKLPGLRITYRNAVYSYFATAN
jgi:hypothetical protein